VDKFPLGQVIITANAKDTLDGRDVNRGLTRHRTGDWGDLCAVDAHENELSLRDSLRLFSVYHASDGTKFWIITEADRSVTTILLPEDY
jgi:hypothetical protein